ncbi:alpha/beta hydrolase [Pseudotenacibaculum sp. MALMAid0570]|uniref:alpha/beta hydrolase n=1 Tax=Pseudotenacibaculum sp. MALMAid0570 TaxID=3143938 RepID=UPI0032DEC82A
MSKKHIYCFPGLGASTKIFEYINLPKESFELHLLEWKMPLSLNESIQEYAARISKDIIHENPVLVGVSFGGMIVQEISKVISTEKVIIISSIKTHDELPKRLKVIRDTRAYKLFPAKIAENIEEYTKYFFGDFLKKRAELYKMYLSVRNPEYMKWAIYNVLHWKQKTPLKNIIHIQGTDDHVFPHKHIKDFIAVEKGTHVMILMKAKTISEIIVNHLT